MIDANLFHPVGTYLGRKFHRQSPQVEGGVTYPTHGIRVNAKIKELCRKEKISILCLESEDLVNIMRTHSFPWASKTQLATYLGWALTYEGVVLLNATLLRNAKPCLLNYVVLHEIEHIRYVETDEDITDRNAKALARRLGLDISCAKYNEGRVGQS
ncbi:MAG: hypothetical protein WC505_06205 [Patescibacteria group bacterium]